MSGARIFGAAYHGFAAFGTAVTAYHVLPVLWQTSVLDTVIVGTAMFMAVVMFACKSITGEWPHQ